MCVEGVSKRVETVARVSGSGPPPPPPPRTDAAFRNRSGSASSSATFRNAKRDATSASSPAISRVGSGESVAYVPSALNVCPADGREGEGEGERASFVWTRVEFVSVANAPRE